MRGFIITTALFGALLATASSASAAEVCGDGVDNDSDLMADEGCNPAAVTGVCESPLDCALTGVIAPKSGNGTYRLPADLSVAVPYGPPLTFHRFYTSLYEPGGSAPAYRKALGPHWAHNYMSWLDKNTVPNPDQVILHTPGGRDILFQYSSTSSGYDYYTAQEGFHAQHLRQKTTGSLNWELRLLDGTTYVYDWSSPTGKLIEIWDTLATPNKVMIAYDGSGQVSTVTDAAGKKRFLFNYTSSVVTSINYQTIDGGTPTTRVTASYSYTSGNPTTVTIGGTTAQSMTYASGYLTKITSDSKDVVAYSYLAATPGKVVRAIGPAGEVGFEYASSRTWCSGGTVVFFNKVGTATCDDDADCGSDKWCGAETDPSSTNTGVCYLAARCVQMTSPDEDLVDTVSYPDGCTGSCTSNAEYDWLSTPDLAGVKEADGNWTSYQRDGNGLVTLTARGDTDSDPTNAGGQKTWMFYGNSSFPGKVTEVRRISELKAGGTPACDASTTTDCARTIYTWNSDGLLGSKQEIGFTLDATGATVSYSYTTAYTYDTKGRLTQVDGPLSGSNDVTDYTYWTSTDVFKDGYLKERKRKKDTTNYLITTLDGHNYWGTATSQQDPDGTFTCRTYDSARGVMTEERVAMASQTSCATVNSADLRTYFMYDPWLRLTKTQNPLGDCVHREYDTMGRISKLKERDDCNPASSGDTIEYSYADGGGVATDSLLMKVTYKDAAGNAKRVQDYTYYDSRRTEKSVNPVNTSYAKSFSYAADGRVSQVDLENGLGKTEWLWDSLNRVDALRRYNTSSTYDTWDSVYAALFGRPTQVTDDNSKSMQRTWDDLGREVKIVSPDSGTTLNVFDAAGRRVTLVEADGTAGEVQHMFTYDNLGRILTEDYGTENCGVGQPVDVSYVYDSAPVTCPTTMTCTRQAGRLAYVKSTLLCNATYADKTLDQETFYAYDDAGRSVMETIRDDSGRSVEQSYYWNKNGKQTLLLGPSGVQIGWTYDVSGNSDANKVGTLTRSAENVAGSIKWLPFGPISEYTQENQTCWSGGTGCSLYNIKALLSWNTAYRPTEVLYENTQGDDAFKIAYTEDARGRTTVKDYSSSAGTPLDTYLTYDWQDRIVCDATVTGTCPTSGSTLRSNLNGSPPYTASNDRVRMLHQNPSYGTYTYTHTLVSGKDRIDYVTDSARTTTFGWDHRGNRTSDDSGASYDGRTYTYDGRSNVRSISGNVLRWFNWTITNAYDHKNRRVFKSYVRGSTEAQWFFYYDDADRLIEIKHTPNIASPSTYSIYQFLWVGRRAIGYRQTDWPSFTASRRYLHSDASGRPIEAWSWPSSGTAAQVWAIDPDAFGWDRITVGTSIFQPLRAEGGTQYYEAETTAITNSGGTGTGPKNLRPPLHLAARMYDPLTGLYLQPVDAPHVDSYTGRLVVKCGWRPTGSGSSGSPSNETIWNEETEMCWFEEVPDSGGGGGDGPTHGDGGGDSGGGHPDGPEGHPPGPLRDDRLYADELMAPDEELGSCERLLEEVNNCWFALHVCETTNGLGTGCLLPNAEYGCPDPWDPLGGIDWSSDRTVHPRHFDYSICADLTFVNCHEWERLYERACGMAPPPRRLW